jgi:hypothetical protein
MEDLELANSFNERISRLTEEKNQLIAQSQVIKNSIDSLESEILRLCEEKEKSLYYIDGLKRIIREDRELLELITESLQKPNIDSFNRSL